MGNPVCALSKYSPNNISFISVDCTWNTWSAWETCSVTCGGGSQVKVRTKNPAQNGGAACVGASTESKVCNTNACLSKSLLGWVHDNHLQNLTDCTTRCSNFDNHHYHYHYNDNHSKSD